MATEVIHNLWLGNIRNANDINFIKKAGINTVFNCTVNISNISDLCIRYKYRIPVKDNCTKEEVFLMYTILEKTVHLIKKHLLNNDIVLVHCHAGRQRSVCIILAFLMKYGNLTLKSALKLLQKKRPISGTPELNFYYALINYEKYLQESEIKH